MAVTRTSVSATMASGLGAITATFGTGATAGDFGLLIIETANQAPTTPAGWTGLDNPGTGTAGAAGATNNLTFYKNGITSGDISSGVAIADGGDHQNAILITYSGVDATTPVVRTMANTGTPATTSVSIGTAFGTSAVRVGDIALAIIATDRDSNTVSTNSSAVWSNVAGSNSFIANFSSATGAGGGIIVNELVPSGNETSAATFACTITSSIYVGIVAVIKAPSGTTVAPSTGHLLLSGYLPTVTKTFNIAPSGGHLTLGGKIAIVTTAFNIAPSTGHLILAGHVPSVFVGTSVDPSTGHLTLSGHPPTITLTVNIAPVTGHLTLGGKVPTVTKTFNVAPLTGHIALTGKTPSITLTVNISPLAGHLLLTGYVPTVDNGGVIVPTVLSIKVTYRHRGRNC